MEEEEAGAAVVDGMMEAVEEITAICDYRNPYRKQLCNLARRIKLLVPMLEEIKDSRDPISGEAVRVLAPLRAALDSAKELLRFGSDGSKICLVLEREKIMKRFQEVTAQLEQALSEISFEKLDISDEVREQVELVHAQFRRAKERVDAPDDELFSDLLSAYNVSDANSVDLAILKRLAEKLQLMTISDLKQESLALHELVVSSGGVDPGENIEKMSMLLKKIKDYVQTQNPEMGTPANPNVITSDEKPKVPVIPDDFRCPISLELMKDPVIVATGQTYERGCIEKWIESGHDTCPKTQQKLPNMSLTPNYVLRSLIAQWCEANGVAPPQRPLWPSTLPSTCSSGEHAKVVELIRRLSSHSLECTYYLVIFNIISIPSFSHPSPLNTLIPLKPTPHTFHIANMSKRSSTRVANGTAGAAQVPSYLLTGKVAIVTGSGRGMGRETALELARRGADVVVNYANSSSAADELVKEIKALGRDAIAVKANVANVQETIDMFAQAKKHFGKIDIVVSNSGVVSFGHLKDVTEEEFDRVFSINTRGQFFVAREAYKNLEVGGRIILMGSITGQAKGIPKHAVYSGSKGAIETFTRCMAIDCGDKKITVNTVAPGGIKTDMYHAVCREYIPNGENLNDDQVDEYAATWSPMNRVGQPIDVARVTAFLASQDGEWINGKVLGIDGAACM